MFRVTELILAGLAAIALYFSMGRVKAMWGFVRETQAPNEGLTHSAFVTLFLFLIGLTIDVFNFFLGLGDMTRDAYRFVRYKDARRPYTPTK